SHQCSYLSYTYHPRRFCFFFSLSRPQPRSTLFPYTTLFRSYSLDGQDALKIPIHQLGAMVGSVFQDPRSQFFTTNTTDEIALGIDRKSTRLNSSHVSISYAVFCLKKKSTVIVTELPTFRIAR